MFAMSMSSALGDGNHNPIVDDVWNLPLLDAHVHYKEPAWDRYPVSSIVELMDKNGVAMALVSSTPDEGTIMLWEYALDPLWLEIFFDFQDRLMIGSDTWVNSQWDSYSEIMTMNRWWLSKLPREVAEKIAYRNAERCFGREISMDQIGTR